MDGKSQNMAINMAGKMAKYGQNIEIFQKYEKIWQNNFHINQIYCTIITTFLPRTYISYTFQGFLV